MLTVLFASLVLAPASTSSKAQIFAITDARGTASWSGTGLRLKTVLKSKKLSFRPGTPGTGRSGATVFLALYPRDKAHAPGVQWRFERNVVVRGSGVSSGDFVPGWSGIAWTEFDSTKKTVRLDVGVADGPWKTSFTQGHDKNLIVRAGTSTGAKAPSCEIRIKYQPEMESKDWHIVAYDRSGHELPFLGTATLPGSTDVLVDFSAKASQVYTYAFQIRPYSWTTFARVPTRTIN